MISTADTPSDADDTTSQVEAIRSDTIAILDHLLGKSREFELPAPPDGMETSRKKLIDNAYKVLVVGEAKRGKSTLINALIGDEILPTDVDVATSQVFCVTPAPQAAYRVRFEDESYREISAEELPAYGSQAVADAGGTPTVDRLIRWIEVESPSCFLPKNISILDTPGLGALYAAHAQITHRFVPQADAVIFVLDSGQPVGQEELDFIEMLLQVTATIFFIQTKIDQYGREQWQSIQQRNEEILRAHFADRLPDTRVWAVSSSNLQKAASASSPKDAEAYLLVSRQKELIAALEAFLFRVAGWGRSAEALLIAEQYYAASRRALGGRLTMLTEESKSRQAELQEHAKEHMQQFQSEWGERGSRRQDLEHGIRRAIDLGKQNFRQALQPSGEIPATIEKRIQALTSIERADKLAKSLGEEITTLVMNKWSWVCIEAHRQCTDLLRPFLDAAEAITAPLDSDDLPLEIGKLQIQLKNDLWERLKGGARESMTAGSLVAIVAHFVPGINVIATIGTIGALIFGYISGGQKQLKSAQDEIRRHLFTAFEEARSHFFTVDQSSGRYSRVDEYFTALERGILDRVREITKQKADEAQAELARLTEESKLEGEQRITAAAQIQQQICGLDDAGKAIRNVTAKLNILQQVGIPPATA